MEGEGSRAQEEHLAENFARLNDWRHKADRGPFAAFTNSILIRIGHLSDIKLSYSLKDSSLLFDVVFYYDSILALGATVKFIIRVRVRLCTHIRRSDPAAIPSGLFVSDGNTSV